MKQAIQSDSGTRPDLAQSHPPTDYAAQAELDSQVPRRLDSRALLGPDREVEIAHVGQVYRLRLTSLGKLILTK